MLKPAAVLLASLCAGIAAPDVAAKCVARSGRVAKPLVELFTSEGCSSCPPADRWLSAQAAGTDANFLAFHVDYWDSIGWPDRFASARYSRRQRERVQAAGVRAVYTPQVMLGDAVQAPWREQRAWQRALQQARRPAGAALTLHLQRVGNGWQALLGAAPVGKREDDAQLWLARYIDGQQTQVRGGENRGAVLHHDRVVRQLSGPWPLDGASAISRKVELTAETAPWGVTAFVQDRRGRILQSLNLPANSCARQS